MISALHRSCRELNGLTDRQLWCLRPGTIATVASWTVRTTPRNGTFLFLCLLLALSWPCSGIMIFVLDVGVGDGSIFRTGLCSNYSLLPLCIRHSTHRSSRTSLGNRQNANGKARATITITPRCQRKFRMSRTQRIRETLYLDTATATATATATQRGTTAVVAISTLILRHRPRGQETQSCICIGRNRNRNRNRKSRLHRQTMTMTKSAGMQL